MKPAENYWRGLLEQWTLAPKLCAERHAEFWRAAPALLETIEAVFYREIKVDSRWDVPAVTLSVECAELFEEILFCSMHFYGLAATRLLRGFYERLVMALSLLSGYRSLTFPQPTQSK